MPNSPKPGRPPGEGGPKRADINIRTQMTRKGHYVRVARRSGLTLSAWMQKVCDEASGFSG